MYNNNRTLRDRGMYKGLGRGGYHKDPQDRNYPEYQKLEQPVPPAIGPVNKAPTDLTPGFYQMYKDPDGTHRIEFVSHLKKVPDNIYGKTGKRVLRYWSKFARALQTIGILLVGDSGAGKSMEGELLCNVAIKTGQLPVIAITGFVVTEQTIQYLEQLDEVVFFFDEFSKHVPYPMQDLLLSLLTNTSKRFLPIMTENDINTISAYLRSRPGRAWYRRVFDKLEQDVVEDYLEQNPTVTNVFKDAMLSKYKSAMTFTFDHLKALVAEHKDYPDEPIDEMLEILNVDIFTKTKKYFLTEVYEVLEEKDEKGEKKLKKVDFIKSTFETYQVEQDRYTVQFHIKPEKKEEDKKEETKPPMQQPQFGRGMGRPMGMGNEGIPIEVKFNIGNMIEKDGGTLMFKAGKYKFKMLKTDQASMGDDYDPNTQGARPFGY